MPACLIKLDKEHDAYALFSTVVDGFITEVMDRQGAFKALLQRRGGPEELIEAAVVRADLSGTSAHDGEYGFDDPCVLFLDGGRSHAVVLRDQLYDYVTKGTVHCFGCGEDVPQEIAYREGPRPFHWNDQGGGHTCAADAYTSEERK